jgi:hypothetical protein
MDGVNDDLEALKLRLRQRLAQLINSDSTIRELRLRLRVLGVYNLDVEMEIENGFAVGGVVSERSTVGDWRGFDQGTGDKGVGQLPFDAADKRWLKAMHIDPDPEFE